MPTTLQSVISKDPNASELAPLTANDTYSTAVNAELASLDAASARADALAAKHEDLTGVVRVFSQAMSGLKSIVKRFPEVSAHIDEAIKKVQLAMGAVQNNPVKPAPFASTTASGAPVPSGTPLFSTGVPAGTPTTGNYTDPKGAIWRYNGTAWVILIPAPVKK